MSNKKKERVRTLSDREYEAYLKSLDSEKA